jgi:hypothetical protein
LNEQTNVPDDQVYNHMKSRFGKNIKVLFKALLSYEA